ncbi:MAG TPA: hypothetical protein VLF43_03430 [Candidatus Saccharimonadales bacterium]|nr:hypothetical protein [Candidatus Saccharimonadales bacterium]
MSVTLEAPQPIFYSDSAILTPEQVRTKCVDWHMHKKVMSTVTAVGALPNPGQILSAAEPEIEEREFDVVTGPDLHLPYLEIPLEGLKKIVKTDMQRSGLQGNLLIVAMAGKYDQDRHREKWHTDNLEKPSVRWSVAAGVGATLGATGIVNKAQLVGHGNLDPNIPVNEQSALRPRTFSEGEVVRFCNAGDIHAGPFGNGPRVFLSTTLRLPSR